MPTLPRYAVIAGLVAVVAIPSCNRNSDLPTQMTNDHQPPVDHEPVVLGQQLADAHAAEQRWRESRTAGTSPFPDSEYDFWRGDLSLIRPNPNPLDETIRHVCRQYAGADPAGRSEIRRSISMDQFYTLITFAKRSAVFTLRDGKVDTVRDGLTAIAMIERQRVDFRDILWCLGLLYHAANRVGADASELFRDTAGIAEPDVAELIVNFTHQTPRYRSLPDSWGYDEVERSFRRSALQFPRISGPVGQTVATA